MRFVLPNGDSIDGGTPAEVLTALKDRNPFSAQDSLAEYLQGVVALWVREGRAPVSTATDPYTVLVTMHRLGLGKLVGAASTAGATSGLGGVSALTGASRRKGSLPPLVQWAAANGVRTVEVLDGRTYRILAVGPNYWIAEAGYASTGRYDRLDSGGAPTAHGARAALLPTAKAAWTAASRNLQRFDRV